MNILSDFSDTLVSSITILYVFITFTVILCLRKKLCKAKSTIDSLRIQHARVFTPTKPAPAPPPNRSEFEMIFESNLNSTHHIRYLIKMFLARLERAHRPPTPHELQYLRSMRQIVSKLEMVRSDIESYWTDYTKNLKPEDEEPTTP